MVFVPCLFVALSAVIGSLAVPSILEDSDFILTNSTNPVRRQDYTQNYKVGGNVQFSATTNGYLVAFSGA